MDPFEKKLQELYQQKKQQDEKGIPRFETFWNEKEHVTILKSWRKFLRMAASVAAITILASGLVYYFNGLNYQAKKASEIYSNLHQPFPSEQLLNQNLATTYIWNWKAPTDKLLEGAIKSIHK
jgi:hypothetical protein